jgi:predicted kinase
LIQPTLVIFSGLPGTGKSELADRLAREMQWPLLRIDDLAACMPATMDRNMYTFWDQAISGLLRLTEAELKLGISVIADSIFMNLERFHAREIARQNEAHFVPIYTFLSDEATWEERVTKRFQSANPTMRAASWQDVSSQQKVFRPWKAGTALFVDGIQPMEENYAKVLKCINDPEVEFLPIEEVPFTPGKYHE